MTVKLYNRNIKYFYCNLYYIIKYVISYTFLLIYKFLYVIYKSVTNWNDVSDVVRSS